jgi:hypothetical protein
MSINLEDYVMPETVQELLFHSAKRKQEIKVTVKKDRRGDEWLVIECFDGDYWIWPEDGKIMQVL